MIKKWQLILLGIMVLFILSACSDEDGENAAEGSDGDITLEYWQYAFDSKVNLMNELIKEFEEENPGITIEQTTFPYDQYNEQVAAQVPAGNGPDVINLFYGWVPSYVDSGYLQPLPQDTFSHEEIENEFFPLVEATKLDGEYWTIPTAVRTLALFYNKDLFEEAGLDPNAPPETWDELQDYAVKLTKAEDNGRIEQSGLAWEPSQQGHHWLRDGLTYQAGGKVLGDDRKEVVWGEGSAGLEAFKYWLSFPGELGTSEQGFYTDDVTAFMSEKAAMNIDGSFRIGTLQSDAPDLNYAVAPLPAKDEKSTNASFWTNGITSDVEGEKLEAASKFIKFLTSEGVMEKWLDATGELPAKEAVAMQDKYVNHEIYGPFIESLPFANAHFFIDETKERDIVIDAANKVLLEEADPEEAFNEMVDSTQELYDEYWSDK
ncbi:multiple sugar transport system substrate-binding protein [Virgibacillus subterraneus]|uniref:Multiple sugar transport system substrate-binding protein n=2 Tax=Virgibacillus TaxID=84406 RepID=A0A1H0YQ37_9BACI|nr:MULTISPECIES: extracellular solute-binding protein [Virgibacillus]SDQ17240.1 multiple sugar transport system substrate-binding protein [Virgibacillus salinus]SEP79281.1 multiple sugar transport system substrate-binding protein [Virgibacillus subterraneus]